MTSGEEMNATIEPEASPASDAKSLGSALRILRRKRGLSITDVSVKINASPSNLSAIELGRTLPTIRTLARILAAYGAEWRMSFVDMPPAVKKKTKR